jgi:acyl transferase domain-containing protein
MFANLGSPSRHRRNDSDATTPGSLGSPWSVMSELGQTKDSGSEPLEPIAIIGLGCRLAGTASSPSALWDMLVSGQTAWTSGPGDRFNMDAFRDASSKDAGTTNVGGGHFLQEDISKFDAALFGINPVEAMAMDPQHRLLLEIAYESFENAGLTLDALAGSNTGVYVGQWANDYHEIETRDTERTPFYLVLGTGPAMAANRISYHFDLRGPSFTIDTGCSSSLVALHQAVQSLRAGETTQCFVGGVNVLLDPARFCYQGRVGMFSDAGRCFAFDSRADGYGRGEGCAGVVIKPLSAALRDGDHIRAVIRNSAVNQDGRTPGISVPSASAQTDAILHAYRQVRLEPRADYVEAHGTGTKVGDPIEANAIAAAFTQKLPSQSRLPIGSVKGNVGHTESASGLIGLIKAVLMLENGVIPPQVNFEKPNPEIPLDELKLRIVRAAERTKLGRVSVNSFGYGGTNAHVIVDSAEFIIPKASPRIAFGDQILGPVPTRECAPRAFLISAASETSCQRLCINLARYLVVKHRDAVDHNEILSQLAYSLSRRTTHAHRVALVAS